MPLRRNEATPPLWNLRVQFSQKTGSELPSSPDAVRNYVTHKAVPRTSAAAGESMTDGEDRYSLLQLGSFWRRVLGRRWEVAGMSLLAFLAGALGIGGFSEKGLQDRAKDSEENGTHLYAFV